jgi:hypothetical protein
MTIQQPRVMTKIIVINDLTRQLPHFGVICLVKPKMNSPLKFLRKMLKLIFLELLIMILRKLTTLTVLHVFQESLSLYLSFPPL